MNIEINILLGLNCNFRCSHCLNNSRPGFKEYDITQEEINKIIDQVESNHSVTAISFSGGEPLLYIDKIQFIVEEIRKKTKSRSIHFSMTTNGSLIRQSTEKLKIIKLDSLLISYDVPHGAFLEKDELSKSIAMAKTLCSNVEIATTFEEIASESPVTEVAIAQDVKVNFNKTIQSGRFDKPSRKNNFPHFDKISCPNLKSSTSERLKLSYFSPFGFSFCCGPLLFDNLKNSADIFFDSIENLLNSPQYQLQQKLTESRVKCNSKISCENCLSTILDPVFKKYSAFFTNANLWQNSMPLSSISPSELTKLDDFFLVRRVGCSTQESFKNIPATALPLQEGIAVDFGNTVSSVEIEEISNFIIDSFYHIHSAFFTEKYIEIFRAQLPIFFNYPFQFVRHRLNGKIVGFMMVALLDNHPFYKKSVWHIGYWGIDKNITDRTTRQIIKNEWQTLLHSLSSEHQISVLVEQFNTPALKMAESFGMDISTLRFDPRSA